MRKAAVLFCAIVSGCAGEPTPADGSNATETLFLELARRLEEGLAERRKYDVVFFCAEAALALEEMDAPGILAGLSEAAREKVRGAREILKDPRALLTAGASRAYYVFLNAPEPGLRAVALEVMIRSFESRAANPALRSVCADVKGIRRILMDAAYRHAGAALAYWAERTFERKKRAAPWLATTSLSWEEAATGESLAAPFRERLQDLAREIRTDPARLLNLKVNAGVDALFKEAVNWKDAAVRETATGGDARQILEGYLFSLVNFVLAMELSDRTQLAQYAAEMGLIENVLTKIETWR